MEQSLLLVLLLMMGLPAYLGDSSNDERRELPNIILIMADDLGYSDLLV